MTIETITITGKQIRDEHTHYEFITHVGPYSATVIIRGDLASDFSKKYGKNILESEFQAEVDFIRNDQKIKECQDPFKLGSHHYGRIGSIDDITLNN